MAIAEGAALVTEPPHRAFRDKLAGYDTSDAPCFCGETEGVQEVSAVDRDELPCRVVICLSCGLLRQTPRLSAESAERFYAEDYLDLYGREDHPAFRNGMQYETFSEFLQHFDIHPKVVYDIGAGERSLGRELEGVELHGRDRDWGGLPDGKADLVILHHVLEHVGDLEEFLGRIKTKLAPSGLLMVAVPGNYVWRHSQVIQLAHNWYFTATTLKYVMECCGFKEHYLDEMVASLWRVGENRRPITARPTLEAADAESYWLKGKMRMPQLRTTNKTPTATRRSQIERALARRLPDITELVGAEDGREAVVLAAGPSVDDPKVARDLKDMASTRCLIACEKMIKWCDRHDLEPDYVLALDGAQDVAESLRGAAHGPRYIVSTQCHDDVFDALDGNEEVYVVQIPQGDIDIHELLGKHDYERATILNSGGSVTIGALSLAMTLGCRKLHVFGFDCHIPEGKQYSDAATGAAGVQSKFRVDIDGAVFTTTAGYLSFAQQFFVLLGIAREQDRIDEVRIYGDSLVKAMSVENINGNE